MNDGAGTLSLIRPPEQTKPLPLFTYSRWAMPVRAAAMLGNVAVDTQVASMRQLGESFGCGWKVRSPSFGTISRRSRISNDAPSPADFGDAISTSSQTVGPFTLGA